MKKLVLLLAVSFLAGINGHAQSKYITRLGKATIYSHTAAEDISAVNNTVTGLINASTGDIAVSVPVQSFQFEKSLMQEHFNNANFMDSRQFPKILLKGKISKPASLDLSKDGKQEVEVQGSLTIRAVTKPFTGKAIVEVLHDKLTVTSKFIVKDISTYGVGKPMGKKKNNVAEDIEVSYTAIYEKGEE